ncbi:MAG: ribonuclease Z [Marinilabiliales bacterium]
MCFKITFLGTGSAVPTPERFSTSQVVNYNEKYFLIDCGEGAQIQLRRFKIKFTRINHIFISHLHGDHINGLVGLVSTFIMLDRKTPLNIYAPDDLENMLKYQLKYLIDDISFDLKFHKVSTKKSEIVYEDKGLIIKSFPLKHKIKTAGYIFLEKKKLPNMRKDMIEKYNIPVKCIHKIKEGADFEDKDGNVIPNEKLVIDSPEPRSYAYCSDTKYYEKVLENIKNVTVLYHEATFAEDMRQRAKETMHSTTHDAANIAKKAIAGALFIGHFSLKYKNPQILLDEAKAVFENSYAVFDGMQISILPDKSIIINNFSTS